MELLKKDSRPLFLRGLFEVVGMTSKLLALQYMTAPQVVALARISVPLSIAIGGRMFQEKELKRRFLLGLVIVFGVVMTIVK